MYICRIFKQMQYCFLNLKGRPAAVPPERLLDIAFICLPLVDGHWNEWSAWSECSASCSNGTMQRTRECNGPSYGGSECHGSFKETNNCFLKECPGKTKKTNKKKEEEVEICFPQECASGAQGLMVSNAG